MLNEQNYRFSPEAYVKARTGQPHSATARSVRNGLDRARLRQATRLYEATDRTLTVDALQTIEAPEILASRLFEGGSEVKPVEPSK